MAIYDITTDTDEREQDLETLNEILRFSQQSLSHRNSLYRLLHEAR